MKRKNPVSRPESLERGVPVIFDIISLVVALGVFLVIVGRRITRFIGEFIHTTSASIQEPFVATLTLPQRALTAGGDFLLWIFLLPVKGLSHLVVLQHRLDGVMRTHKRIQPPSAPVVTKTRTAPPLPPSLPAEKLFTLIRLPERWGASIGAFALFCAALLLPFFTISAVTALLSIRSQVVQSASAGVAGIETWKESIAVGDYQAARSSAGSALANFSRAQESASRINSTLAQLASVIPVKGRAIKDGQTLLQLASEGGQLALSVAAIGSQIAPHGSIVPEKFLDALPTLAPHVAQALGSARLIAERLATIQPNSLPRPYRESFEEIRRTIAPLPNQLVSLQRLLEILIPSLGIDAKKRYLFVFQNNTELRPTGGFIGSFALVDIDRGRISKIEVPSGGPYDLSGTFHERLEPPLALRRLSSRWQFHDANWFADFPTSAQKLMWFYERSGGSTVDGVISVNASLFEKILAITGPIPMQKYGKIITAENFIQETQKSVELEYDKTLNKPKQFIADLVPEALKGLSGLPEASIATLGSTLSEAVTQREIQAYFISPKLQSRAVAFGVSGKLEDGPLDYLLISDANVAGNKSDAGITATVHHSVMIKEDDSVENTVELTKVHAGDPHNPFAGKDSRSFVRFLVPSGSVLLDSAGFSPTDPSQDKPIIEDAGRDSDLEALDAPFKRGGPERVSTSQEQGKTVFGGIMETAVGASTTVSIRYRLPFRTTGSLNHKYLLYLQRQSGSRIQHYDISVRTPDSTKVLWSYPAIPLDSGPVLRWEADPWTRDQTLGILLKRSVNSKSQVPNLK